LRERLINKRYRGLLPIAIGIHDRHGTSRDRILSLHTQAFVTDTTLFHPHLIPRFFFPYVGLDIFIASTLYPRLPSGCAVGLTYTFRTFIAAEHGHLVKRNRFLIQRGIFVGRLFLALSVVFVVGSHDPIPLVECD